MSDVAYVRKYQGQTAVFRGFVGDDQVEVSVGDRVLILSKVEWRALPLDKDWKPTSGSGG